MLRTFIQLGKAVVVFGGSIILAIGIIGFAIVVAVRISMAAQ